MIIRKQIPICWTKRVRYFGYKESEAGNHRRCRKSKYYCIKNLNRNGMKISLLGNMVPQRKESVF